MLLRNSYQGERFTLNMGFSRAEFMRTLPAALTDLSYTVNGETINVELDSARRVTIELGSEQQRRIALISITNIDVSFAFEGFQQPDIETFMSKFMARYQRGGG